MIRNTENTTKRHQAIVDRFYELQRELFSKIPKLKGYVYPNFFYKEISEEKNLTERHIQKVIQKAVTRNSKMTRL